MVNTINLSDIEDISHPILFQTVRDIIREENLDTVNALSKEINPSKTFYAKHVKRVLDVFGSSAALVITAPVNVVLAFCTYFDVGHPVFFHQKRIGEHGKPFEIIKFRNMTNEKDENGVLLPPNLRVTKFGRFVRKTSLDELLNFYSVLKGDMSLIGPRPLLTEYVESYSDRHMKRHAIKPGLECPIINSWNNKDNWADQFENDVYYVENVSFLLDVKMVFKLVRLVFDKNSTKTRGNALKGSFMGYEKDGRSIDSTEVPAEYFYKAIKRLQEAENDR